MNFTKKIFFVLLLFVTTVSSAQTKAPNSKKVTSTNQVSEFVKSPYLLYTGKNTEMLILWQTASSNSCRVDWGTDLTYATGNQPTTEYGTDHQHKLTITGLTPGTKYFYKVTVNNAESKTGDFITGVADNETAVSFYTYGDTRTYPANHDAVAKKILDEIALDPKSQSIMMFNGDFVQYGNAEESWTNEFFDPQYTNIQKLISRVPYLTSMGNHEGQGLLFAKYYPYPQFVSGRYYYSFDYGPIHFTIIDQYTPYTPGSAQYTWLENDLATSTKPWKIIMDHEPGWSAYPISGGNGNNLIVQNYIHPLCLKYDVQFVFSGHNHFYSRADVNNVMHITTGGGGAPLYPPAARENIVIMDKSYHFCKMEIDNTNLKFKAQRSDGTIIESFDYVKSNDPGIYLSPRTVLTKPAATHQLSAVVFPKAHANEQISWTSDNTSVATVSSTGLVSAASDGNATITASVLGGTKSATVTISVAAYTGELSLDNCDATTGWTVSSSNAMTLNTTDNKEGSGCIQIIGNGTEEYKKISATPFNSGSTLANAVLKFWYYISDVTKTGTVKVELGSGGKADTNEFQWGLTGLVNGWNQITLKTSTASKTGEPDLTGINWFRIYATKTGSVTIRIDDIRLGPEALFSGLQNTNEMNGKSVKIYPNPHESGNLFVDLNGFEDAPRINFIISNLSGQVVFQKMLYNTSRSEIILPDTLQESIYLVSVEANKIKLVDKLMRY
ncbi:MAG: T9SS type A sorting domain-containing protein [Paludibacter sp.]|nr:T9SS type A sorting domain-containing protein [Paludibacter sp.]